MSSSHLIALLFMIFILFLSNFRPRGVITKSTVVWDVTPYSLIEIYERFIVSFAHIFRVEGQAASISRALCLLLVACLGYYSTLKTVAVSCSETSVNFYQLHRIISQKVVILTFNPIRHFRKTCFYVFLLVLDTCARSCGIF
jgi:hypothetical protein